MKRFSGIGSSSRRGFSLIEVLLALAVLGIAILSIMGLLNAAFVTVGKTVMTRQALSVYGSVDNSLSNVTRILSSDGRQVVPALQSGKTEFDYVYDWVRNKTGKNWEDSLFLVCFMRRLNPDEDSAPQRIMQVIKCEGSGSMPNKDELNSLDIEGPAYFVRLSISAPQIVGQNFEMDTKGEVLETIYSEGTALPASSENYALAYIPLIMDVYPYTPDASEQDPAQTPLLTQLLVYLR